MTEIAIRAENLSKAYKIYERDIDRLKEALNPFHKRYSKDFYALRDINFEIRRGENVGLVGRNGAGKSTLLNILCGILRATGGVIFYNGVETGAVDMAHVRRNCMAVVAQKDFLRNDTLSGGERRKFSIDAAFAKNASVLIMDEPDNNLDAAGMENLRAKITAGKAERITIVITHDARLVEIADAVFKI